MKIALFGGTFDPIHSGHVAVAGAARDHFALTQVLIVPNDAPPHKRGQVITPYEHRLAMARLAVSNEPGLAVSEIERGIIPSYTINTIERLRPALPAASKLFLIIGADAFAEISTWYRVADVLAAVEFIVVSRPGHSYSAPAGARVHRLDTLGLDISSSFIRQQLAAGQTPADVPGTVAAYIAHHRLYGAH